MTGMGSGLEATTLIVRIGSELVISPNHALRSRAPALLASILDDRIGETVVLGTSDVPGIWTCHALANLGGYRVEGDLVWLRFDAIRALPVPEAIVTAGDSLADSQMMPYALDVWSTTGLSHVLQHQNAYEQPPAPIMMAQEASGIGLVRDLGRGGARSILPDADTVYRIGLTYGWRCAFTGLPLSVADDNAGAGEAINVHEAWQGNLDPMVRYFFVSSAIAECYANGLLAIGEDYDIVRHRMLPAEIRTLLDVENPRALLFLPEEKSHWPSLELARMHRTRSGL